VKNKKKKASLLDSLRKILKPKKRRARSSITGRYVSLEYAKKHPDTTEIENV